MNYALNNRLRKELKKPFGYLIQREEAFRGECIVVGDACLSQALEDGKQPVLGVYDNLVKRKPSGQEERERIQAWQARKETVRNPAGTITEEAVEKIRQAIRTKQKTKLEVRGEEDLLVLPCLVHTELDSNVYYGQPGEGIVLVKADEKNKEKAKKILEEMRE